MARPPEWERLDSDTDKSWEAFTVYRDLGSTRTLDTVAKVLGKSPKLIERWSPKHEWVRRAGLWDAEVDRAKLTSRLDEIEEMDTRHAGLARLFQQAVLDRIREIDIETLSPSQLIAWFEVAVKIERQSVGKPGEIMGEVALSEGDIPPALSKADVDKVIELSKAMTGRPILKAV